MTMSPIDSSELLELLRGEKGEKKDPLVVKQQEETQFRGISTDFLKEEKKRLEQETPNLRTWSVKDLEQKIKDLTEEGADESQIKSFQDLLDLRKRYDLVGRELERKSPTPTVKQDIRTLIGQPVKVRKEKRAGQLASEIEQTLAQDEPFFQEGEQFPEQLEVGILESSPESFIQGLGMIGALDGTLEGQSSGSQFTPYESPVTVPGGLGILGILKEGDRTVGFRVQWGADTIDWYPEDSSQNPWGW